MSTSFLDSARAIESLRTGVPNGTAVRLLGCSQPRVSRKFDSALDKSERGDAITGGSAGLLIKGGFGSGKSHTLTFLSEVALRRRFVVSRISINKETPLSDPDKLFRALAESAVLPDRRGAGLFEAAQKLVTESDGYRSLEQWAQKHLHDERIAASLRLFRVGRRQFELRDQIAHFWCGDRVGVHYLKSQARELNIPFAGAMKTIYIREFGHERMQFASRMLRVAGYSGWVWLIDEVELIGCYSLLQRLYSYCEIGRLMSSDSDLDCPGVVPVLAITDDFESAVLAGKQDLQRIPSYFHERCNLGWHDRHYSPLPGIAAIQKEGILLDTLPPEDAKELYNRLAGLYQEAYGWEPGKHDGTVSPTSTTVRQQIKRWVTLWDVERLLPGINAQVDTQSPTLNYREDSAEQSNDEGLVDEILKALE